jgi:hypothetical protein
MATKKKIAIEYTQNELRKEFKGFSSKNQINTKDNNAGNERQKSYKTPGNKLQSDKRFSLSAIIVNVNCLALQTKKRIVRMD